MYKLIIDKFSEAFNGSPILVRAPGRINLIGEHTDYNDGYVLPAAIDKEIILAVSRNDENTGNLLSFDYNEQFSFDINELHRQEKGWPNYIMGVVSQLKQGGHSVTGFNCVFGGNIPIGAGLSSSAAVECGIAYALNELFDLKIEKSKLIQYAQKAEHEFAGVKCGIMDQFASTMGKEGHAIQLDCRSLDFKYFPLLLNDYQIILCDTQVKHSLASSEYNTRRNECEEGVEILKRNYLHVNSLRDASLSMIEKLKSDFDPVVYKRCKYVVEENQRLLQGCELLHKGDIAGFGNKMYGSHYGLSREYEVSCEELDFLVDFTRDKEYVVGARMMGGGFGGCTINILKTSEKDNFIETISKAYKNQYAMDMNCYEVNITDGVGAAII